MKNQSGVTLTILIATIIVLALITGTISYNSFSNFQMNAYYNMRSDIELLDEKIALYYLENKELPIQIGDTKTINEIYDSNNINYNPNNNAERILYKINLDELDNLSLNYTDYYIDTQSHTIYKGTGMNVGEKTYYTIPYPYTQIN